MIESHRTDRELVAATIQRSRMIVAALAGSLLIMTAASGFLPIEPARWARKLVLPAGLIGLFALVVGWRLFVGMAERAASIEELPSGCARYARALLCALAVTDGAGFVGIVVFAASGQLLALTGVFTHVLLTAVLWPAMEKLQPFLGHAGRNFAE